jgi:formylglycine-generating enzyme
MRARRWLVLVALLAGGCNQILGIHPGILDTGDAAADDGGVSDAGRDGRDASTGHDGATDDAGPGDGPGDGPAPDTGPKCTGQCGDQSCGDCPTNDMVAADTYQIDATEVTNAQYAVFLAANPDPGTLQATKCQWNINFDPTPAIPAGKETYPVIGVNWCDAYTYCTWARKRLCGKVVDAALPFADYATNQSQWYAACKPVTGNFPYGLVYGQDVCNGEDHAVGAVVATASMTACVGSLLGLHDMSGNVAEWEDSCDGDVGSADQCRIRGGSFQSSQVSLRCDADASMTRSSWDVSVGFRCCRD